MKKVVALHSEKQAKAMEAKLQLEKSLQRVSEVND